jgi:hypothetical protein
MNTAEGGIIVLRQYVWRMVLLCCVGLILCLAWYIPYWLPRSINIFLANVALCPGDPGNDRGQGIHEPRRDDEIRHVTLLPPGVQLLDDGIHAAHEQCG